MAKNKKRKINECELGRELLRNGNRTKHWPDGSHERERKGIVSKERPGVREEKHHHSGGGEKRERGNVRYLKASSPVGWEERSIPGCGKARPAAPAEKLLP